MGTYPTSLLPGVQCDLLTETSGVFSSCTPNPDKVQGRSKALGFIRAGRMERGDGAHTSNIEGTRSC